MSEIRGRNFTNMTDNQAINMHDFMYMLSILYTINILEGAFLAE